MCSGRFTIKIRVRELLRTLLFMLWCNPGFCGISWSRHNQPWMQDHSSNLEPVFQVIPTSGFTVIVGQTVLLPCTVRNLGDKTVSWMRTRDLHILTVGEHTYTSDNRFEVVHGHDTDSWGLRIKKTRLSDSGKYECQVNTDPKMNNALLLTVTDPHMDDSPMVDPDPSSASAALTSFATIRGPKEQYVRAGTTITFTCVVSRSLQGLQGPHPSRTHLRWSHAGRDITFQFNRGGISVDTDYRDKEITSRLTVATVGVQDAGSYTCGNADVRPDSVSLVIVEGERTEAMMRDHASRPVHQAVFIWPFILYLLRFLY